MRCSSDLRTLFEKWLLRRQTRVPWSYKVKSDSCPLPARRIEAACAKSTQTTHVRPSRRIDLKHNSSWENEWRRELQMARQAVMTRCLRSLWLQIATIMYGLYILRYFPGHIRSVASQKLRSVFYIPDTRMPNRHQHTELNNTVSVRQRPYCIFLCTVLTLSQSGGKGQIYRHDLRRRQ